jgi:hypothetical protein
MPLVIRIYECGKCGFVIGRDHNSASDQGEKTMIHINTCLNRRR